MCVPSSQAMVQVPLYIDGPHRVLENEHRFRVVVARENKLAVPVCELPRARICTCVRTYAAHVPAKSETVG